MWDLAKLGGLAAWDQQTMMPPRAAAVRAQQLATISKVVHEQIVSEELGELLEELRPYEESLDYDSDEASLIRVTRRDRDKELRVPGELREAQARAGAEAFPVWVEARRTTTSSSSARTSSGTSSCGASTRPASRPTSRTTRCSTTSSRG